MSRLIIAEKPSVGKTIAAVLGADQRRDGYLEGNGNIVTWCFGFLSELSEPEVYDACYGKWRREDLPIQPDVWQYTVMRDKKKQLDLIAALARKNDVTELVNACDAGREGERIFRNVYQLIGCRKPMLRLWISSMEDAAIRKGFSELRPGADYDHLAAAADCRAKADWLVGVNGTRLFSVLYHRTLNVGRVLSPTLAMIVQRETEIQTFRSEPFYTVSLEMVGFHAESERFKDRADAEELRARCEGQSAAISTVENQEKSEKPPALYDLTTLQRDANCLLGFTAQQTLDYTQSLYEKKLCTYPRTDSRYLADDMEETAKEALGIVSAILAFPVPVVFHVKQVLNSKKVSDHHAIIPTTSAAKVSLPNLPAGEAEILKLLSKRMLVSVSDPYRYRETIITVSCADALFTAKGKQVLDTGWRVYDKPEETSAELPVLTEEVFPPVLSAKVKEGKTTAPERYTEDTLLSAMETAGAKDMPEDAERKGLGTPATRAEIMEKLVSTGFVERQKGKKKTSLVPTQSGISLVTVLPEQFQSPLLTAEWENRLKQVESGESSPEQFMREIGGMVSELVSSYLPVSGAEVLFPSSRSVVGKCPRCGGNVTESKQGYFCERNNCRFGIWHDNRFLIGKHISLNKKMMTDLLKDGKTFVSGIYSEKTGKSFDAYLLLRDEGTRVSFGFEFQRKTRT